MVISLWRVKDRFTAELMSNFYKQLSKGKNVTKSLRASKLDFLSNADAYTAHPSNWSAFVPVGKDPEIKHKAYTLYYILFFAAVMAGIILFIRRRKHLLSRQNISDPSV
jgi:hypothetical protein